MVGFKIMAKKRLRQKQNLHTTAGPVTIIKVDGSVDVKPAYSPRQVRRITKDRPTMSKSKRESIMRRDQYRCRYCETPKGPFQIDHVIPIADGGLDARHNLVTACIPCNSEKGTDLWYPKPIRK